MIQISKLSLALGARTIFDDFSCTINENQRVGLVGRNGSGKTTLLNMIAGHQQPDAGTISIANGKTIGYFPQDVVLTSNKSILDETFSSFEILHALTQGVHDLEKQLEQNHDDNTLLERYAELQAQLAHENPEKEFAKTKKMLLGLGFSEQQFDMPVTTLSVGWKMRLVLAKLLLKNADFYLFDEPTNHLDLIAKDWFLGFLKKAEFGFVLVCHERYFLDELCSHILELEHGNATMYHSNYSKYEELKEESLRQLEIAYENQQKEIKRKTATIERFRAKATKAKMAQSMLKALEKVELITLPPSIKDISFTFPEIVRAGKVVLSVKNVAHNFGKKEIFSNVSFEVLRGQKVAVVAPNGVGKTTLFNIICGNLKNKSGTVEFGYNVNHAIFAQDQATLFYPKLSVIENIGAHCPSKSEQELRSMLGAFLFSGDDVHKKVKVLSGGEKNRLGMVRVLLQDANLLLLDEPTNHLDITSKDLLLKALKAYPGTILFVSHDRDFINKLATHIVELTPTETRSYHGNYDSYLTQKEAAEGKLAQQTQSVEKKSEGEISNKLSFEDRKKIKRVESKIHKLEKQIEKLEQKFVNVRYGTSEFDTTQETIKNLKNELDEQHGLWEQLYRD